MLEAVCIRCGAAKDAALGRCGGCGLLPTGNERELSVLCSKVILGEAELLGVQERLRRGEALRPSGGALERARVVLGGRDAGSGGFSRKELGLILLGNIVFTPILGYAVWFRAQGTSGQTEKARQALLVTLPVSLVLGVVLGVWRWYWMFGTVE